MSFFSISLPAGGAFAPYERFAFGKTSGSRPDLFAKLFAGSG